MILTLTTELVSSHGCNFFKSIGGGVKRVRRGFTLQRVKSARGTIKILLKSDFSPNLTNFSIFGGGFSPTLRGARALPKRYKVSSSAVGASLLSQWGSIEAMQTRRKRKLFANNLIMKHIRGTDYTSLGCNPDAVVVVGRVVECHSVLECLSYDT